MLKKTYFFIAVVGILFIGSSVDAKNPLSGAMSNLETAVGENSGTGLESDLATSVGTVIKGVLALVGTIFLVLTVWAGILWMTAQGNSEKADKAKGIIQTAVIGLFVVISAYAITAFVADKLGNASTGNRPTGCCIDPADNTNCSANALPTECGDGVNWIQGPCPSSCNGSSI